MRVILPVGIAACVICFLIACNGGGGSSSGTPTTPDVPPTPPPDAPAGVQVVAGDGSDSVVQNTISWVRVPDASDYVVYWSNSPGVSEADSSLPPVAAGSSYAIHSGADVVQGNSYYYRIAARADSGDSTLSSEASGIPQSSATSNNLNDVAWNGFDRLVAVGDAGTILSTPNATHDGWVDVSSVDAPQALAAVTWEDVNNQFLVVGAGSTVLRGDGVNWTRADLANLPGAINLNDVTWIGDRYLAVGNSGTVIHSNSDGSAWSAQRVVDPTTSLNAVATNGDVFVVVGINGTILTSEFGENWVELPKPVNNDLNDITWDGQRFTVVGSNDTVLTSSDGVTWTEHVPGTSDINFVGVTQWDAGLPENPIVVTVGSSGTYVATPSADPGTIIPTGTNAQLGAVTWVDDGVSAPYFVIVGHAGTVLTNRYNLH